MDGRNKIDTQDTTPGIYFSKPDGIYGRQNFMAASFSWDFELGLLACFRGLMCPMCSLSDFLFMALCVPRPRSAKLSCDSVTPRHFPSFPCLVIDTSDLPTFSALFSALSAIPPLLVFHRN